MQEWKVSLKHSGGKSSGKDLTQVPGSLKTNITPELELPTTRGKLRTNYVLYCMRLLRYLTLGTRALHRLDSNHRLPQKVTRNQGGRRSTDHRWLSGMPRASGLSKTSFPIASCVRYRGQHQKFPHDHEHRNQHDQHRGRNNISTITNHHHAERASLRKLTVAASGSRTESRLLAGVRW